MTFLSYAQNFEDVLLWRALKRVEHGFYVDVGAQHPDTDSVTRAFYERGWRGVNVEPSADHAALLRAARPRDVTLELALGAEPGEAEFLEVPGTGLSTTDEQTKQRLRAGPFRGRTRPVTVSTLAEVFRRHVRGPVHFLKIDVEGAERAVLAGADFWSVRPWIVLVEATAPGGGEQTHGRWEDLLLRADYAFAWFDGLNRFYLAAERADELRPYFATPPNVFDDFIRSAEGASFGRIAVAETELARIRDTLADRERELARLRDEAGRDAHALSRQREDARAAAAASEDAARQRATTLRSQVQEALQAADAAHRRTEQAQAMLSAMEASSSWVLTAPVRWTGRLARRLVRRAAAPDRSVETRTGTGPDAAAGSAIPDAAIGNAANDAVVDAPRPDTARADTARASASGGDASARPAGKPPKPPLPLSPPPPAPGEPASRPVRVVHQFHSGSAVGDAITNAMLFTRQLLRDEGFESEIFTEQPAAGLEHELKPLELIPRHDRYVLIVHHSMGYDRFEQVLALPARKVLLYHNITPPEFLRRHPVLEHYAELGRRQLTSFRGRVEAVLGVSDHNLVELHRLGLGPAERCTLLFDPDALRQRADAAAASRPAGAPFTVLFVGRIVESKNQALLVEAFARFRAGFGAPCRLVLAGRSDDARDPYARALRERIDAPELGGTVQLAGAVDDAALDRLYAAADLYVSASRHEGFGVTLVEAMAHGVPILAWPAGAVPHTARGAAAWLDQLTPDAIAAAMLDLARDRSALDRLRRAGRDALDRFALPAQVEVLRRALSRAGAEPARPDPLRERLADTLRVSVFGHANGSYSLAVINRELARRLDAFLPGRVRLQPVEGGPTAILDGVPAEERAAIAALAARPPHATGPELVISQHYPLHVPEPAGDVTAALLFWEETLIPRPTIEALCAGFDVAVAPTRFVARALADSGCRIPVRVIPPPVALDRFAVLRDARAPRTGPHRFLHVSSCFPRKGVDVLLRAWARAFAADDPVRLVIKGFPNPHNEVAAMIEASLRAHPSQPPIEFVDRDLDGNALLDLYRDADTMVLPTRGEGLNLPAAEAMAAGLPLIVTDGGGHLDFCRDADGRALPGVTLLPAGPAMSGSHLATPFSQWLEPDEDALVTALRDAVRTGSIGGAASPPPMPAFPHGNELARRYTELALDTLLNGAALLRQVRVSWVSTWNLRCGVSEYSRQLLGAIEQGAQRPLSVRVLCDRRTPRDGSPVHPLRADNRYWPCWKIGDDRSAPPIAAAIAADDADAVVIQHQPGLLSFRALAALARDPALAGRILVVTLHNTRHLLDLEADERAEAMDGLAAFQRVVVHTVADQVLLAQLGLARSATLLPHGVPASVPIEAQPPTRVLAAEPMVPSGSSVDSPGAGSGNGGPLIGCYGFLLPGKGIPELIQALALLRDRWPDARLLLVNALYDHDDSRDELARCRSLIASLGLTDAVALHTAFLPQHESMRLLRDCDVLALPYRPSGEGSSAAMRGALASGAPVAVTPIALFTEADDAVFRFADEDPAAIAAGLDGLLADHARRDELRATARRWMADRSWDGIGFRMAGMVAGLVRTRRLG